MPMSLFKNNKNRNKVVNPYCSLGWLLIITIFQKCAKLKPPWVHLGKQINTRTPPPSLRACNSHVDNRYKKSLIVTMLDRAFKLSSNWSLFHEECIRLKTLFLQLAYPKHFIQSMISNFITCKQTLTPPRNSTPDLQSVRIVLPFKEQKSTDFVRKQLKDLVKLLNIDLCPVFISRKVGEDLKHKEIKPALINEQSVVYKFGCGCLFTIYPSFFSPNTLLLNHNCNISLVLCIFFNI